MAAHSYWRLNITANQTVGGNASFGEVEMRSSIDGADLCTGGVASASTNYSAPLNQDKAFDNSETTSWVSSAGEVAWLKYQFASPVDIVEYSCLSRSDSAGVFVYTASAWTLEWSDDNTNWTVADTRTGQNSWFYKQKRIYTLGKSSCRIVISESSVTVPSNFLGMHDFVRTSSAADSGLRYSAFRAHDCSLSWDKIETSDNVFDWTNFDLMVNAQVAKGATISFPVQGTPVHAVNRAWLESKSTVWQPSTVYSTLGIGTVVRATDTSNNRLYILTQAGTSGATEPAWPTILAGGSCGQRNMTSGIATVIDGTCIWQVLGDVYNNVMGAAPQDPTKLTRFITALLTRYNTGGNHKIWALELGNNEPNFSENYTFFYWGSAVNLVDSAYTAKQAALAVDATVKFLSPGFLNSNNFVNTTNVWMNALITGGGGLRGSDIVDGSCWHPYTGNKETSRWYPKNGDFGILKHWQAAAAWASARPNIPLYNTEWGTSTSNDADLVQFNAESPNTRQRQLERFLAMNAACGVSGVYLYAWGNSLVGRIDTDTYGVREAINRVFDIINGKTITKSYEYEDGSIKLTIDGVDYLFGDYNKKSISIFGTTIDTNE